MTGSTNADLVEGLRAGRVAPGAILAAEQQVAGRGRLGRGWTSPARSGLTFSMLLSPAAEASRWGWLPLLTGLAVRGAVQAETGLEVWLKWPNDVLDADGRKLAGVLAERVDVRGRAYVVLGVGLNVTTGAAELPVPTATSLLLSGADRLDREALLLAMLGELADRWTDWERGTDPLSEYRAGCATIGRPVRVEVTATEPLVGTAVEVDELGRLVVETAPEGERRALSAGDVIHLR